MLQNYKEQTWSLRRDRRRYPHPTPLQRLEVHGWDILPVFTGVFFCCCWFDQFYRFFFYFFLEKLFVKWSGSLGRRRRHTGRNFDDVKKKSVKFQFRKENGTFLITLVFLAFFKITYSFSLFFSFACDIVCSYIMVCRRFQNMELSVLFSTPFFSDIKSITVIALHNQKRL